jgi:hypothetical protein
MHFSLYLIIAVCKFSDSDEGKSVHSNFLSGQQLCGWAHRSHARQVSNISVQINSNLDIEGNSLQLNPIRREIVYHKSFRGH